MNTEGQRRAKVGGETGVNGEFYEGGKFLPSTDGRPKTAPGTRHELSAEEQARRDAWRKEQDARAERIRVWLEGRRKEFGGIIALLTRKPADYAGSDERWKVAVENHAAGFLPSLARSLWVTGSLTPRQAEGIAKAIHGRRTKANGPGYDGLIENLTRDFESSATV